MGEIDCEVVAVGVQVDHDGATCPVAGLAGELDLSNDGRIARRLHGLLEEHGALTVDLGALSFMDSSGVHLLEGLRSAAAERGWRFDVDGANGAVARLLGLVGYSR